VKDLSYIVRGGRLPGWVKKIADFIHIRPVLSTKDNGSMGIGGVIRGTSNLPEKMSKLILGKMDADKSYNISIGHSNTLEDGEKLMNLIQKGHSKITFIYLMDIGCALGVHAGPGSLAVGIQPV
jgi:fatty acid-binding protein DegV